MALRAIVSFNRLEMGCLVMRLKPTIQIHVHSDLTVLVQVLSRETLFGCEYLRGIKLCWPENIRVHDLI